MRLHRTRGTAAPPPNPGYCNFTKFRETLPAFRCEWDVASGAHELSAAFDTVGLTLADFDLFGRYTRLAELRRLIAAGRLDENLRWTAQAARR